jgi:hypothetical protein
MKKCPCKNCRRLFEISPQRPDQKYCKRKKCQRARKNAWQKEKIRTDEDYRQNQKDAQERWCKKNPDYYKTYREKNPAYTKKNRLAQVERNRKKRSVSNQTSIDDSIAKMDMLNNQNSIKSGRYTIISADNPEFAKMDVLIVDISIKSKTYKENSA